MKFLIYQIIIHALIILAPIKFAFRGLKQPDYFKFLFERFGIYRLKRIKHKKIIWFHCVSVGETKAIDSLLKKIVPLYKDYDFLITHSTPTGRDVKLMDSNRIHRAYLCLDSWFFNQCFLNYFSPKTAIFLETEIWPGMLHALNKRNIPALLINARLSDKSLGKYLRFKSFSKEVLNRFNLIIAQSEEDQQNFNQLTNKKVLIYKNLKFNQLVPAISKLEKSHLLTQLGLNNRKIISLISSRDGEEDLFLDAMKNFLKNKDYALIIVPRHPQRFQEVKNIIQKKGYSFNAMSSPLKRNPSVSLVIGDTMGEVYKYIGLSDLVFIGGSFKDYGSHSPIESILLKKPVVVGPSTFNFKSIINSGLKGKVFLQIKPDQISETIKKFFEKKYNAEFKENINVFLKENQKDENKLIKLISKYF